VQLAQIQPSGNAGSSFWPAYSWPSLGWPSTHCFDDRLFAQAPGCEEPGRHTTWLTTTDADGSAHLNAAGAIRINGVWWFETGRGSRRARNIVREARCASASAVSLREFDLVVESLAALVNDPAVVGQLARGWADEGWPCEVDQSSTALTAPYSAQSAGPPPWHASRLDVDSAHAVQTVEPYGATRWRF
jgi:hypothetical protein